MKNNFLLHLVVALSLSAVGARAQEVREEKINLHGTDANGFVAICSHNINDISDAMTGEVEKAGLKRRGKNKKFYTLKGVDWPAISTGRIDVYYKVQKKGKHSKILFVVSKGYNNYVVSGTDAVTANNINTFLSNIDGIVERHKEVLTKEAEINAMNARLDKDKAEMQRAEADKRDKEHQLEQIKNGQ